MNPAVIKRFLFEPDKRLLRRFAWNFGWHGMRSVDRFNRALRRGQYFPAFVFLSITDRCNLSCQGCWVTPQRPPRELSLQQLDGIVNACRARGVRFFGLLGGEPLLHPDLFDLLRRHPDCYFQLFTNGTLLNAETACELRKAGNVTPLVSIEGDAVVSDTRRGGENVYARSLAALEHCRRERLITGVASSVCRSNLTTVASDAFLQNLEALGVLYAWYYIYRPVGPRPCPELALDDKQITALREFLVERRRTARLLLVDSYWDADGRALCPAATGIAVHVSPDGKLEPCPPIQFADTAVQTGDDFPEAVAKSAFLEQFRQQVPSLTRGCVLMDCPHRLAEIVAESNAKDSTGRGTGLDELNALTPCPGHHQPGREIPERSPCYRFAKRHWFFGFGAYG